MNEMIKAERNKICSRKQTRMLFLAGVVLIVAYFFFFQFNYQNVFYDYDLEKMALASGFTAIEQRKEVAEIFEGKLSQNTLLTMQEKIDQIKHLQSLVFAHGFGHKKRAPIHPQCGANRRSMYITIFNFICYNCMVFKTSAFFD